MNDRKPEDNEPDLKHPNPAIQHVLKFFAYAHLPARLHLMEDAAALGGGDARRVLPTVLQ